MKSFKLSLFLMALIGMFTITSCGSDDDPTTTEKVEPIASFQLEISETNFLEVAFMNFSSNATSQSWDFGDGNSSAEESPTHTYSAEGTYTVTLTAINDDGEKSFSKDVTITNPNSAAKDLTGETFKVWKLIRDFTDPEYPMQVGPADRSQIWWAYGREDAIGSRPCLMEEEYIFNAGGTFTYNTNGEVFADYGIWSAEVEGQCIDDRDASAMTGPNGENLLPWGGGDFTFEYDVTNSELTVSGLGAHIGLPKVATSGEVSSPQDFVRYKVISLETAGAVDKLVLETSFDGGYWQFVLVSYDNPADEPDLPGAAPIVGFTSEVSGNTVSFNNSSVNADSYLWDFGDGNMSTEENPSYTYANDDIYSVVLTATNGVGEGTSISNVIISTSNIPFSASALHGDGNKVWTLKPISNAQAVGSFQNGGDFFATSLEDVTTRGCTFDDTYEFTNMGAFNYNTNGDLWAEAYMGVDPAGCIMEAGLPADAVAWGSGNHNFTIEEATSDAPAYITVTGTGAFIGLAKAFNGGEYAAGPPATDASVRYEVLNYLKGADTETLVITLDISDGETGGAWWTFTLESK